MNCLEQKEKYLFLHLFEKSSCRIRKLILEDNGEVGERFNPPVC